MAFPTRAEDAPAPPPSDYVISTLQTQRNEALDREALCRRDTGPVIFDLKRQLAAEQAKVADLQKEVTALKGAATPK